MPMQPPRRTSTPEARKRRWRASLAALLLVAFSGAAGCADEEAEVVNTSQPEYDGVSRDQIQSQVEPMTPEEAEALGIIDTTARLPPQMNPDSIVPLDVPQVVPPAPDSVPR